MADKFRFLNLYTNYKYRYKKDKKFEVPKNNACFAAALNDHRSHYNLVDKFFCNYEITIHRGTSMLNKDKNNNCLLSEQQLTKFINVLKRYVNFNWKYKKASEEKFTIDLNIEGVFVIHKLILFWIRQSYEFPFNVLTLDAERFRTIPSNRFFNIFQIYKAIFSTYDIDEDSLHSIFTPRTSKLHTSDYYRELLKTRDINNISGLLFPSLGKRVKFPQLDSIFDGDQLVSVDFWTESEEDYPNRLKRFEIYKKSLKQSLEL